MGERQAALTGRFPPYRLTRVDDAWFVWLRPLWFLALALAVLVQIAGFAFALYDASSIRPAYTAVGLTSEVSVDDDAVLVGSIAHDAPAAERVADGSRIVAINGTAVPVPAYIDPVAKRLNAAGPVVRLSLRDADGKSYERTLTRTPRHAAQLAAAQAPLSLSVRLGIRLVFAILGFFALLVSATLLFVRRPRDPVALLLSFAFLTMTATIDPPLGMWMIVGLGDVLDVVVSLWWVLLVVALSAFPDGQFEPRWLRWNIVVAPLVGILLATPVLPNPIMIAIGILIPLGVLLGQLVRFRRLDPGIERQQIKWAAFGFAAGLILLGFALVIIELPIFDDMAPIVWAIASVVVLLLFSLSFAVLPLGLLVSLLRFRLWEADAVISRSVAYAIVTIFVGFVWAASSDIVKDVVASVMGKHNAPVATTFSAMLAAVVFAPTQSVVLGWTKRRFGKEADRLRALPARLDLWRNTETSSEVGMRALAVIAESVHADSAALLALTPTGRELIAARDIDDPETLAEPGGIPEDDPRFPLNLSLEDVDGPVGVLLIGPRSDGNRYNRDERGALAELTEPLAEALRFTRSRAHQQDSVHRLISAVEQRLSRLEDGPGEPSPA